MQNNCICFYLKLDNMYDISEEDMKTINSFKTEVPII